VCFSFFFFFCWGLALLFFFCFFSFCFWVGFGGFWCLCVLFFFGFLFFFFFFFLPRKDTLHYGFTGRRPSFTRRSPFKIVPRLRADTFTPPPPVSSCPRSIFPLSLLNLFFEGLTWPVLPPIFTLYFCPENLVIQAVSSLKILLGGASLEPHPLPLRFLKVASIMVLKTARPPPKPFP